MTMTGARTMAGTAARTRAAAVTTLLAGIRVADRVDGRDGPLGTVAGTRAATGGHPAYVLVRLARLLGFAHATRLVPAAWVRAAPGAHRVTLDADRAEIDGCLLLRDDEAVRADVTQALALRVPPFRVEAVRAAVRDGVVELTGHAPSARDTRDAAARARAVPGVLGVRDHAVDDDALVTAVAAALTLDPDTRKAGLRVASRLGEIELQGVLPSEAARREATALALAVGGVTQVHNGATVSSARTA
jgi:osmotically-inducible protein OsmY